MSMTAGTVTVADDESVTGTGLARARYDADVATLDLPALPTLGATTAPYSAARPVSAADIASVRAGRLLALRERARVANAYAAADVTYFQANMVARISTSTSALQQASGVDTTAPTATRELPIF